MEDPQGRIDDHWTHPSEELHFVSAVGVAGGTDVVAESDEMSHWDNKLRRDGQGLVSN